jgi:quinol monooxygenase YgiN
MYLVLLRMKLPPETRNDVIEIFRSIVGPTLAEPGCLWCRVFSAVDDDAVTFIEEWKTREKLERHIRSENFRKILLAMDCASEKPEIRFNHIASVEGMELVRKIRGA